MDDIVSECKKRMARFRIQELKDVLGQVGVAKTGRKQFLEYALVVGGRVGVWAPIQPCNFCFFLFELTLKRHNSLDITFLALDSVASSSAKILHQLTYQYCHYVVTSSWSTDTTLFSDFLVSGSTCSVPGCKTESVIVLSGTLEHMLSEYSLPCCQCNLLMSQCLKEQ
ncbi:hypothetical protein L6452_14265 [Arctium lappa]|uniref:Uncharacterized protein n=1 Tax=Arctium lappa TaxID=4217 RepID=A0ACB9CKM8_ARCLA|nr:hypothetical protein L6452_14265 [Arctium lappa]